VTTIFRGISSEFNNLISNLGNNEDFIKLLGPSSKQIRELYLDELVLRFITLYFEGDNLNESISSYMTDFMKREVSNHHLNYDEINALFLNVIQILSPFGPKIFRSNNGVLSTSLYDAITIGIARNIGYYNKCDSSEIEEKINKIKNLKEFQALMGSAASSHTRVRGKLKIAMRVFTP
jgi:hypothetical protein